MPLPMPAMPIRPRSTPRRLLAILALVAAGTPLAASAQALAPVFIDSPAGGVALNARGDAVGSRSEWPCGNPQLCAPVSRPTVWRGATRSVLPPLGSLTPSPQAIDRDGRVAGTATDFVSNSRAVLWLPGPSGYAVQDLGLLPGATSATALGFAPDGRVIGNAASPTGTRPFTWSAATGLVDLTALGFPAEALTGVGPDGTVVTRTHTYRIDDPASVRLLGAPPPGFYAPFPYGMAVNAGGDVASFLATTTSQSLFYLHRYHAATGLWQLVSSQPNGSLTRWGVGSIGSDATIVATVGGSGVIADGPAGLASPLGARISAAYPESAVTDVGMADERAGILARMVIGRSPRLVRLVPALPCASGCLRVATLAVEGRFVDDPNAPGSCTRNARNEVRASVSVVDESGRPVPAATVRARWLDDYDLNRAVAARTDAAGALQLRHRGPACRGAIALLVESVRAPGARLDRTAGTLTAYAIPLPR